MSQLAEPTDRSPVVPAPVVPAPAAPAPDVLTVEGLDVTVSGGVRAVRGVSFTLGRGEAVGLVGESGSGKSLTCRSALGVLPAGCEVSGGRITLGAPGAELTAFTRKQWDAVRGRRIGAVFQDPASYLNPSLTVGRQLTEQLRVGAALSRAEARTRAVELFTAVGLHRPEEVFHQYPHELSGGMLQRVLIAIAVSCSPELLIADEATTALDVVIQAEILELLQRLRTERGLALLLVTHDLAVVAESCDRVLVMYAGRSSRTAPPPRCSRRPRTPIRRRCCGWRRSAPGDGASWTSSPAGCPRPAPNCPAAGSPTAAPTPSRGAPRHPSPCVPWRADAGRAACARPDRCWTGRRRKRPRPSRKEPPYDHPPRARPRTPAGRRRTPHRTGKRCWRSAD